MKRKASRERLLELLKEGGIIELSEWGLNPMIDVRSGDTVLSVHKATFISIRHMLIPFKHETLTTYYKLKTETQKT